MIFATICVSQCAATTSAMLVGETFGSSDTVGACFIMGACVKDMHIGDA